MISLFVLKFNASFLENMRKLTIQSFNKKEPLFFKFSFIFLDILCSVIGNFTLVIFSFTYIYMTYI